MLKKYLVYKQWQKKKNQVEKGRRRKENGGSNFSIFSCKCFLLKLMPVHTTNIPLNYANSLSKILIANTRAKSII